MSQARGKKKDKDFVDLIGRKKWDLEEYERKAQEKLDAEAEADRLEKLKERRHRQMIVRDPLRQRTKELELWKNVGKFRVINSSTPESQKGGFYCEICETRLMDSLSWMNHINGKRHNRNLGMSMRPARATASDVRNKLRKYSEKKHAAKMEAIEDAERRIGRVKRELDQKRKRRDLDEASSDEDLTSDDELETRDRKRLKEEETSKDEKEAAQAEEEEEDEEMKLMRAMGMDFTSFGGSRKNN